MVSVDGAFIKQDSINIAMQIEKSQTIFAKDLFVGKILLSDKEEKVQLRNVAHLLVRLSRPIFCGNNVWIYIEHFCGNNCGSGEIQVYKIYKSGYTLLLTKQIWIN